MQLRLACNSPHNFYWPWANDEDPDRSLIFSSGKMLLLDQMVPYLLERDHKILIFSQFKTQLDILEDWATLFHSWPVCRIDGSVKQQDRRSQIKAFNEDPDVRLFLLSTRAGGQGINLAAADTVILFDSDWNPQQDLQAQDRAHRIGQKRPVIVYRLATKGTVEQLLLEKAQGKRKLERLVIQKGKFKTLDGILKDDDNIDDLRRILMDQEFEKYEINVNADGIGVQNILSDKDLEVLTDRSEEAYRRAAEGLDASDGFEVMETREGDAQLLAQLKT
jgi:ATP-dependent DNA helicase